ncbi:unnamed protein product, partial [Symbiodinium microadriaticum]
AALSQQTHTVDGVWPEDAPLPDIVSVAELSRPLGGAMHQGLDRLYAIPQLFWASCVAGLDGLSVSEKKNKMISLGQLVLKTCLKVDNDTLNAVATLLTAALEFKAIVDNVPTEGQDPADFREATGVVLRQCKELWRSAVLIACSVDLAEDESLFAEDTRPHLRPDTVFDFTHCDEEMYGGSSFLRAISLRYQDMEIIRKYQHLFSVVERLGLDGVWTAPALFDGNELCSQLGVPRGPQLGVLVDKQFRWQLRNPMGQREECLNALRIVVAQL